jgi:hypothetical protein
MSIAFDICIFSSCPHEANRRCEAISHTRTEEENVVHVCDFSVHGNDTTVVFSLLVVVCPSWGILTKIELISMSMFIQYSSTYYHC